MDSSHIDTLKIPIELKHHLAELNVIYDKERFKFRNMNSIITVFITASTVDIDSCSNDSCNRRKQAWC